MTLRNGNVNFERKPTHAHESNVQSLNRYGENNSGFDTRIGVCSNFHPKRKHSITQSSVIIRSVIIVEVHNDKRIRSLV